MITFIVYFIFNPRSSINRSLCNVVTTYRCWIGQWPVDIPNSILSLLWYSPICTQKKQNANLDSGILFYCFSLHDRDSQLDSLIKCKFYWHRHLCSESHYCIFILLRSKWQYLEKTVIESREKRRRERKRGKEVEREREIKIRFCLSIEWNIPRSFQIWIKKYSVRIDIDNDAEFLNFWWSHIKEKTVLNHSYGWLRKTNELKIHANLARVYLRICKCLAISARESCILFLFLFRKY